MEKIKIGIVGIGMVGATLKRWLEERKEYKCGEDLFCYDKDPSKGCEDHISQADIVFVCVPTPAKENGECNISIVENVVGRLTDKNRAIVVKSTVPPGTMSSLAERYKNKGAFLFNPEFLTEAQAWNDFIKPDLQIVAPVDERAHKWVQTVANLLPRGAFQSPGVFDTRRFYEMGSREATITKYGINVFGAVKVAFFNFIYEWCQARGADFDLTHKAITSDRRIGDSWSNPLDGDLRGFTGYCFPKDFWATIFNVKQSTAGDIAKKGEDFDQSNTLLMAARFLEAIFAYNRALLKSQGYDLLDVMFHSAELKEKIKKDKK